MAKTAEIYIRSVDVPATIRDEQFVMAPGNRTGDTLFVPTLPMGQILEVQKRLEPTFGAASDQVFMVPPEFLSSDMERPLVVATGICAFPMEYNAQLNPKGGPGTAKWFEAVTGGEITLPANINEAVELVLGNPPPLTIANLMKAGGIAVAPTILIEEVRFYTDWMLEKLMANSDGPVDEATQEALRDRLAVYVREQFTRNREAFERMRQLVLGKRDIAPVIPVEDTVTEYREQIDEQVARWQRELPNAQSLDLAALRAAAYYSSALERAYRAIGLVATDQQLIIAEGASNLIVPANGTAFNETRRTAFGAVLKDPNRPLVAGYPSPSLSASLRKAPLEAGPVTAGPSTRQPELDYYMMWPKGDYAAATGPVVGWSFALPGTPTIGRSQFEAMRAPGCSPSEGVLLDQMAKTVKEVLIGNEE